jgi:hypothetical protein
MIFEDTKELLHLTEKTVLGIKTSKHKIINRLDNIILHNIFGFIDVKDNARIISRTLIIAIMLFVLASLLSGFAIPQLIVNGIFAFIIAMIFSPLIMPSQIAGNDIKDCDIKFIHGIIKKKKPTPAQLQAIKSNLSILEATFDTKVKTSKWIIAALWAIFLYLFSQYYVPDAIAGKTVTLQASIIYLMSMFFIAFLYLCIISYCKTGKRVFLTLLFSLNECTAKEKDKSKK